jgi:hypothetical protein
MKFQRNAGEGRPRTLHTDVNCVVVEGLVREIESKFVKRVLLVDNMFFQLILREAFITVFNLSWWFMIYADYVVIHLYYVEVPESSIIAFIFAIQLKRIQRLFFSGMCCHIVW